MPRRLLLFVADDGIHGKELWRSDGVRLLDDPHLVLEPGVLVQPDSAFDDTFLLATVGDVNGDGLADFALADPAPGRVHVFLNRGLEPVTPDPDEPENPQAGSPAELYSFEFLGRTGAAGTTLRRDQADVIHQDYFLGEGLFALGNVNGDSYDDYAVTRGQEGSGSTAGSIFIHHGAPDIGQRQLAGDLFRADFDTPGHPDNQWTVENSIVPDAQGQWHTSTDKEYNGGNQNMHYGKNGSTYEGLRSTIRLRFHFDTVTDGHNGFLGWHVDDVVVRTEAADQIISRSEITGSKFVDGPLHVTAGDSDADGDGIPDSDIYALTPTNMQRWYKFTTLGDGMPGDQIVLTTYHLPANDAQPNIAAETLDPQGQPVDPGGDLHVGSTRFP